MTTPLMLLLVALGGADAKTVSSQAKQVAADTVPLYRWYHQNPELSGQEVETAKRTASELRKLGMEVHEGIGGHGIVALLHSRSGKNGRVVLYRADMDGLPITEATGLPYSSKNVGVMHACGHDVHMSVALGTLRTLHELDAHWKGTVFFVAQPAEETGRGAREMLEDARFKKLLKKTGKPKVALGLHDAADMPAGDASFVPGFSSANVDSVDIIVHGKGGHGARPNQTIDPVLIAADIVVTLQSIVARRVPPGERAVITVGKIAGGTKHNIIPAEATLLLTVRSYGDAMRQHLLAEIRRVALNVARAHGATRDPEVISLDEFTPAGYNDPAWTEHLERVFSNALGAEHVHRGQPSTGGEDFSQYGRQLKIPAVMYRLGTVNRALFKKKGAGGVPAAHSAQFAPDPGPTLRAGITTMTLAVLEGLTARLK